jgi:hypothetical protein
MTDQELAARLDDIDAQLGKLFEFQSRNWQSIKRQAAENALAQGTKPPFSRTQEFGEVHRPKPHEVG